MRRPTISLPSLGRRPRMFTWGNLGVLAYSKPLRRRTVTPTQPTTEAGRPLGLLLALTRS